MQYTLTNKSHDFMIMTDDYSKTEVKKGTLKKHLLADIKAIPFKGPYLVLDANNNLLEVITMY